MNSCVKFVVFQTVRDDDGKYETVDLGSAQSKNNETYLFNEKQRDDNNER